MVSCDKCGRHVFAMSANGPSKCERVIACDSCTGNGWTVIVAVTPSGERKTLLLDPNGKAKRIIAPDGTDAVEILHLLFPVLSSTGKEPDA